MSYHTTAPPRPRKRRIWPWFLAGALIFLSVPVSCLAIVGTAVEISAPRAVHYEITGDGPASNITYSTRDGQAQANDTALPWALDVEVDALGAVITAQRASASKGTITCRITDDTGAVTGESSSSGPYAAVTCSAPAS